MAGTHMHPYAVQNAAFLFSLIPIVLLAVMMIGARFFDGVRRARKPAPRIVSLAPMRPLIPSLE
jgi:hypothetical protein